MVRLSLVADTHDPTATPAVRHLPRRRLGARRAARPRGGRPRLGGRRRHAGDDAGVGLPAGRPRLSRCSCTPRPTRNTRSRAPSASTAAAIAASSSSRRRTSRSRRTCAAAISRSTPWRGGDDGVLVDPFGGAARPARGRPAPRVAGFRRGSAARAARRALRRALRLSASRPRREALMRALVASGELDALAPERVWQELARGLWNRTRRACSPCCATCGALARLLPGGRRALSALRGQPPAPQPELDSGVHEPRSIWAARTRLRRCGALRGPDARPRQGGVAGDAAAPQRTSAQRAPVGAAPSVSRTTAATRRGSPRAGMASSHRAASCAGDAARPPERGRRVAASRAAGPLLRGRASRPARRSATRPAASARRDGREARTSVAVARGADVARWRSRPWRGGAARRPARAARWRRRERR